MRHLVKIIVSLLLLSSPFIEASPKKDNRLRYGILSDLTYFCDLCSTIYRAAYWEDIAKKQDANAVIVRNMSNRSWLTQLQNLDVLIIPLPRINLQSIPSDIQDEIRKFAEKGGILVAQNTYENTTSNMKLFTKMFGFTAGENTYALNASILLNPAARDRFPGLPETIQSNYQLFYFSSLDPAFTPIYTFQNSPVIAIADIGEGALILFGFSESEFDIGTSRLNILFDLVQMTRTPVF